MKFPTHSSKKSKRVKTMNDKLNVSLKQDTIKANQSIKTLKKNTRYKVTVAVTLNGVDDLAKVFVNAPDEREACRIVIDEIFLNYYRKLISVQEASK